MSPKSKSILLTFARLGVDANPNHPQADEVRKLIAWTEAGATGNWDNVPRKERTPKAPKAEKVEGVAVNPKAAAPKGKKAKPEGRLVTTASPESVAAAISQK